jgi:hypothetical protein
MSFSVRKGVSLITEKPYLLPKINNYLDHLRKMETTAEEKLLFMVNQIKGKDITILS